MWNQVGMKDTGNFEGGILDYNVDGENSCERKTAVLKSLLGGLFLYMHP